MSRDNKDKKFGTVEEATRRAAAYLGPLGQRSSRAAKHGVRAARAGLAPRIERTGQALEESVAPKVASYLSTAARHLAPDAPRRSRWHLPTRIAGLAAAAGAVAALVRRRQKPQAAGSSEDTAQADGSAADTTA